MYVVNNLAEVLYMARKDGFKERLDQLREERNMTLGDVASAINRNTSALSLISNGKQKLTDDILTDLSTLFGVSKAYLLGESNLRTHEEEFNSDLMSLVRYIQSENISQDEIKEAIKIVKSMRDLYNKKLAHM